MSVKLICTNPTQTIYDVNIKGGVSITHTINSGTDLDIGQVTSACLKFSTDLNTFTLSSVIEYWEENIYTTGYVRRGTFYIDTIEKENEFYTITAYDAICKFDINIDTWLSSKDNVSLKTLFGQLCSKCNIGYRTNNFINYNFTYNKLDINNITGRALLQYISAIAGGFVRIHTANDSDYGKVEIAYYTAHSTYTQNNPLTSSDYFNFTIADYYAPAITAVRVQASNGYCARPAANSAQELQMDYNPILNLKTIAQIQTAVGNIYTQVSGYGTYYPCIFELYADPGINCGDILYVKYPKNGAIATSKVLIMTKEQTGSSVKFSASGNSDREVSVTTNNDKINQLQALNILTDKDYVSYDYFTNNTTKVFNGNIQCNDVIISGLGYTGNLTNTSLLSVIQWILSQIGGSGGIAYYSCDLSTDSWGAGIQQYTTAYTNASLTVEVSGSVQYTTSGGYYVLYCNGITDGYANIKYNNNTIATYTVGCYTITGNQGSFYLMEYPSTLDYESTYYTIKRNGVAICGVPVSGQPVHTDYYDSNVSVEILEEGINFCPRLDGIYEFIFQNPLDYSTIKTYRMKFE